MGLIVSLARTLGFFLGMFLIQPSLKVKKKKFFAAFYLAFVILDLLLFYRGYLGFVAIVMSVFFIERIAFKNNNFKSLLYTIILVCICFISRIIVSMWMLMFRQEFLFKFISNGFPCFTSTVLSILVSVILIFVQRHLVKKLKEDYSLNNRYIIRLSMIDGFVLVPIFLILNILYRYSIRNIYSILKIESLNYIFFYFVLIVLFIGIFIMYIMNVFFLSRRKFNTMMTEAEYDALTNVFNRRSGMRKFKETFEHNKITGENLVVCFLDVNDLKLVNDRFGHPEGDELIKTVATIAKQSLRNNDYMIRYGGDEFIIIFQNCSMDDAKNAWKRIRGKYEHINYKSDKKYRITVSAGFASMGEHNDFEAEELIDIADTRMYRNKSLYKSQTNSQIR